MAKKIRELKALLRKAGFTCRPGKGSHTVWRHPQRNKRVVLSGKDGSDAKIYQETEVAEALRDVGHKP
jgi:predicted RNA binding protein YcfA (HicA-like mRNA interferase family)